MDPQTLLIASIVGHAVGTLVLWLINRLRSRNAQAADLAKKFATAMANAIEQEKDTAKATGDSADATVIRSITRRIAAHVVADGVEPKFTEFLSGLGLNTERKLGPMLERDSSAT